MITIEGFADSTHESITHSVLGIVYDFQAKPIMTKKNSLHVYEGWIISMDCQKHLKNTREFTVDINADTYTFTGIKVLTVDGDHKLLFASNMLINAGVFS